MDHYINFFDPDGLFRKPPSGDAIGYNVDFGGPGSWEKSSLPSDIPNISLTKGKAMAVFKMTTGTGLIIGGILFGTVDDVKGPAMIAGGIVVFHEGFAQVMAEWLVGGDTSPAPDFWWEAVIDIAEGAAADQNATPCP